MDDCDKLLDFPFPFFMPFILHVLYAFMESGKTNMNPHNRARSSWAKSQEQTRRLLVHGPTPDICFPFSLFPSMACKLQSRKRNLLHYNMGRILPSA
uniref:Uncharacterized protein n=1 Tax=Picea glauca TaxID=3330 RepID=A0A101M256_PICGL|nr:hypothetical protein ABT39_MTgene2757 [Picea glauca]QHR89673.1 hypothetical protein Q903MT_gene3695 [Picea sitchensis]